MIDRLGLPTAGENELSKTNQRLYYRLRHEFAIKRDARRKTTALSFRGHAKRIRPTADVRRTRAEGGNAKAAHIPATNSTQSPRKRGAPFRGAQGASGRKAAGDAKAAHIPVTNSTVLEKRRSRFWSRRRLLWLCLLRRFRFPARGSASHAQALKPAIARAARLGARHWVR